MKPTIINTPSLTAVMRRLMEPGNTEENRVEFQRAKANALGVPAVEEFCRTSAAMLLATPNELGVLELVKNTVVLAVLIGIRVAEEDKELKELERMFEL